MVTVWQIRITVIENEGKVTNLFYGNSLVLFTLDEKLYKEERPLSNSYLQILTSSDHILLNQLIFYV